HRAFVRRHGCVVKGCDGLPMQCAHVRLGTDGGMAVKPSDCWTVQLCETHHREQHGDGELTFWDRHKIDAKAACLEFPRKSTCERVREKAKQIQSSPQGEGGGQAA